MKKTIVLLAAAALAVSLLCLPGRAGADAADITKACKFTPSTNAASIRRIRDGNLSTHWKSAARAGQTLDIAVGGSAAPGGLYIRWFTPPPAWTLYAADGSGGWAEALKGGGDGMLAGYYELPETVRSCGQFRLAADGGEGFDIVELSVYSEGGAPYYAPSWQALSGRVDVMVVSAHPDDDVLYMGAVIPTCAQQGKTAVTVYMTYGNQLRRFEAMEGAWIQGERVQPVMGPFQPDKRTYTLKEALKYWSEKSVITFLVRQIRLYKPSVIVSHDVNGEYGHGAHLLTASTISQAFELSGDSAYDPESAELYGAWKPAKLYLHDYKQNKLIIDVTIPLPLYGGRTAFEVAKLAYTRHFSQHQYKNFQVRTVSIRAYGLRKTNVGPDAAHDDMFENVTLEKMLELNPWYLYETVDRAALADAIGRAELAAEADYTAESWADAGLAQGIAAAKAVNEDRLATQAQVDAAAAALTEALGRLVEKPELTGIAVVSPPGRLLYWVGDALDLSGIAVKGIYDDGSEADVAVTVENASGFDSSAPAKGQTVTLTVDGKTASFTVDILQKPDFASWKALFMGLLKWLGFVS